MVRHVILWELKAEYSAEEKAVIKQNIKTGLESLAGVIPGLVSITVNINGLASSNADCMLDSVFANEAALQAYQQHPAHQEAANTKVRPFVAKRLCLDF